VSDSVQISEQVQAWLRPLGDEQGACGPDLEYDNAFLSLQQAAAGKPETQFQAAEPPDWRTVRSEAEALLDSTRDLRVAMLWARGVVQLDGLAGLVQGLALCIGLLREFGDELHPRPEDGDDYARMNSLALLADPAGLLGDLRAAVVVQVRGVDSLRLRDFELAHNPALAGDDETVHGPEAVRRMLADAIEQGAEVAAQLSSAQALLRELSEWLDAHPGSETQPDLRPARQLLHALALHLPQPAEAGDAAEAAADEGGAAAGRPTAGFSGGIGSRADALRAIDAICAYLERAEPSNPAQLLLRRAQRLIDCNFLELVKELAPGSLPDVARIMGIDPDQVGGPTSGG
jgi:type VI secretion system protein ImpA